MICSLVRLALSNANITLFFKKIKIKENLFCKIQNFYLLLCYDISEGIPASANAPWLSPHYRGNTAQSAIAHA